jgi:hypothetical protein
MQWKKQVTFHLHVNPKKIKGVSFVLLNTKHLQNEILVKKPTDLKLFIPQTPNDKSKRAFLVCWRAKSSFEHSGSSAFPLAYIRPKWFLNYLLEFKY